MLRSINRDLSFIYRPPLPYGKFISSIIILSAPACGKINPIRSWYKFMQNIAKLPAFLTSMLHTRIYRHKQSPVGLRFQLLISEDVRTKYVRHYTTVSWSRSWNRFGARARQGFSTTAVRQPQPLILKPLACIWGTISRIILKCSKTGTWIKKKMYNIVLLKKSGWLYCWLISRKLILYYKAYGYSLERKKKS